MSSTKNETPARKEPQEQNSTRMLNLEGAFSMKYLSTHIKIEMQSVLSENFLWKQNYPIFYLLFVNMVFRRKSIPW